MGHRPPQSYLSNPIFYLMCAFYFLATVIPRRENLNIINVTQLEKDAILVCYSSKLKRFIRV